ncbi:MAG: hypothetical protein ACI834_000678 [Colwellia sp.]|jgi:hypothetical protein|tara:strand:- start:1044 stop:1484 length:441 start_codon:yes stop_codon:yes gene_type:complete
MNTLIFIHSYLSYAVLLILILAVSNALKGWLTKKPEFSLDKDYRISLLALILSHIQLLLGLAVYFTSASGFSAIQEFGMGGLNSAARMLAVEHPFVNILAIALITIGWSKHKKVMEATAKFKKISIFYGLGLLLILSRIPWGQWFS